MMQKGIILGAALAILPLLPAGAVELELREGEKAQLEQGRVIVQLRPTHRSTMKDVVTIGYVDAPLETVWRVITDYDRYPKMFPSILKSETRKKDGLLEHHYSLLDYPWPFPDRWTLNAIEHHRDRREISWKRIEGTVKELEGSWQLYPEGERTLVVYSARFDPGIPLIPSWVIEWGSTRIAPQTIQNVRQYAKPPRQN